MSQRNFFLKGCLEEGVFKIGLEGSVSFIRLGMVFDSIGIHKTVSSP